MKVMNKYLVSFLLILALYLTSCNIVRNPSETESGTNSDHAVMEGMTVADIDSLQIDYFRYSSYLFLSYDGYNIVARISSHDQSTLEEVYTYAVVSSTDSDFEKIKPGMTFFQVVEAVGLPEGSLTSGMKSLYFKTIDGNTYNIYFNDDNTVNEVVSSIQDLQ